VRLIKNFVSIFYELNYYQSLNNF